MNLNTRLFASLLASTMAHSVFFAVPISKFCVWQCSHVVPANPLNSNAIQVTLQDPQKPSIQTANSQSPVPSVTMNAEQSRSLALQISRMVNLSNFEIRLPSIVQSDKSEILSETFYPASALTKQPRLSTEWYEVGPRDTSSDLRGTMLIAVLIDHFGAIQSAKGLENDLGDNGKRAVDAALKAIMLAKFQPGEIQGQQVGASVNFVVEFHGQLVRLRPANP